MRSNYKRVIASRLVITLIAVCVQIFWIYEIVNFLAPHAIWLNMILRILAFLFVLYVANQRNEGAFKVLWLIIILTLPLFGTIMYIFWGDKKTSKPLDNKIRKARKGITNIPFQNDKIYEKLKQEDPHLAQNFAYIEKKTGFPVLENESTEYFKSGEELYKSILENLKKAKKFIFVEYFIIAEGKFWNSMLDIMEEKAKQGVDVRVIYDDFGSLTTLPGSYSLLLAKKEIKCIQFNPIKLFFSGTLNNRDHRKILVIDGKVAFSGGCNLADEYINEYERFGHWKDIGFKTTGAIVQCYAYMFAEFWNAFSKDKIPEKDIKPMKIENKKSEGYIQTYYDSPTNPDAISNDLYNDLLSQATEYAWFYTPYLMLGDTLRDSFIRAAKRGVDVRIFMPGIPDKAIAFRLSRSYYKQLLAAGVKIFEYTPGFLHAKAVLVDDNIGTIGTVNLDYRSFFLHFECNTLFYKVNALKDLKKDMIDTEKKCKEITISDTRKNLFSRIFNGILRIFAPLF